MTGVVLLLFLNI